MNQAVRLCLKKYTALLLMSVLAIVVRAVSGYAAEEVVSITTATTHPPIERRDVPHQAPFQFNKDYVMGYFTDSRYIVTSPARWDTTDWVTATVLTGVSVGLYANDTKIQKWVLDHKTRTTSTVGDDVTVLGSGYLTAAVVGGMYLYGHAAGDGKSEETALLSVESFVLTGVMVQAIKRTTGRHRPYTKDPYDTWGGPTLSSSEDSFPSGHASSAFSVATVIALEYDNAVVPPLAYGVAAITGYNRMQRNAHWASDVFVGSAIGYFTGKAIVASHKSGRKSAVSISPMIDKEGAGMMMTYVF